MTTCAWICLLMTAASRQEPALPLRLADQAEVRGAAAEEHPMWRTGVRFQAWTAFGEPANDMMGGSIYGSYNLKNLIHEDWWFTLQVHSFSGFDFERPDEVLFDIKAPPTVDAVLTGQFIRFTMEWHPLPKSSLFDVYVGAGFGIVLLGDGDAHDRPTSDIDLKGKAGVDLHAVVGAAVRVIGPVYITVEFNASVIFAGWDATDRVSGRKETFDQWEAAGIAAGLEIRF